MDYGEAENAEQISDLRIEFLQQQTFKNLFTMAMAGGLHSKHVKRMIFGYPTFASDLSYAGSFHPGPTPSGSMLHPL